MALGLNKIVLANASTNTPGAYWQLTTLTVTSPGTVIPAGSYILFPNTNVSISAVSAYNTTTNAATWTTVLANNSGSTFLVSDGVNVAANATTNSTITLATVNGGQAVSGTYNAS